MANKKTGAWQTGRHGRHGRQGTGKLIDKKKLGWKTGRPGTQEDLGLADKKLLGRKENRGSKTLGQGAGKPSYEKRFFFITRTFLELNNKEKKCLCFSKF